MATNKKKNEGKLPKEIRSYATRAEKAAKGFVADLIIAIQDVPRIKAETEEAYWKEVKKYVDKLCTSFVNAIGEGAFACIATEKAYPMPIGTEQGKKSAETKKK